MILTRILSRHASVRAFSWSISNISSNSFAKKPCRPKFTQGAFVSTTALTAAALASSAYSEHNATFCEEKKLESISKEAIVHDTYGGITVYLDELQSSSFSAEEFSTILSKALEEWRQDQKRGIWLHIPTKYSHVISNCVDLGFEFQHATKGLVVMTQWLPDEHSRLPHGPTHQVGIGAVILHPITGEILAVQEKTGPAAKMKLWKMPTGLTDPGEDINVAAIREVKEEIGLDVIFDKIICIRQAHGGIFNQSDMFFVCLLKLSPKYVEMLEEGQSIPLVPQEDEIESAEWMDLEEFCAQPTWKGSPLYEEINNAIMRAAKESLLEDDKLSRIERNDGTTCNTQSKSNGLIAKTLPVGFRPGEQTVYLSKL